MTRLDAAWDGETWSFTRETQQTTAEDGTEPVQDAQLTLVLEREHETYPRVELTFHPYDSANALVTLNGEATVFAARSDVDALLEALAALTA